MFLYNETTRSPNPFSSSNMFLRCICGILLKDVLRAIFKSLQMRMCDNFLIYPNVEWSLDKVLFNMTGLYK